MFCSAFITWIVDLHKLFTAGQEGINANIEITIAELCNCFYKLA